MVMLGVAAFLVALLLLIFSVLDVLTTPRDQVRRLPRAVWLPVVVLLVVVGPVAWILAGRPTADQRRASRPTAPDRSRRVAPEDDDAFVRDLRRRAEQQRAEAERQRHEEDEER